MSYLDESLAPGERVIARFRLHWTAKLRLAGWLLIAGVGLILAALFLPSIALALVALAGALYEWIRLRSIELGVTSQRVVRKTGIISRETEEVRLTAVETIDLHQSTWGRLLGFGDVRVTGRGEASMIFGHIADPVAVKRAIETAYAAHVETKS